MGAIRGACLRKQRGGRNCLNGDMAMGAGEVGIHSGSLPRPAQRLPAILGALFRGLSVSDSAKTHIGSGVTPRTDTA